MSVFQLPAEVLRVGHPTPFALRDKTGNLLVARGVMVTSEEQRQQLIARDLYVDAQEGDQLRRAIAGKLDSMVRQNALIGQIAQARPDASLLDSGDSRKRLADPLGTWAGIQLRTSAMQRDPTQADFAQRVQQVQQSLLDAMQSDPDVALLVLVQQACIEAHEYSVKHGLLVAVICELAARQLPGWTDEWRTSLRCAALTMNVAMTALQNQLALQDGPVSAPQRALIDAHAAEAERLLRAAGISDALWLGAVRQHHGSSPGPLAAQSPELQLARLIGRADIFAARLSPRKRRRAMSATAAAKAAYLDENNRPDEAGSAIIKALGIYPPGSLVRLASGEVAVVVRRGRQANEPVVRCVVSAGGTPLGVPAPRDTRQKSHEITGGVAPHEVNLRLSLGELVTSL
jgi:hypothetical protein